MPRPRSSLTSIFPSPAMARLVVFFVVHPGGRIHLRELMRRASLPSASIQAELRRLSDMGALRRMDERGRVTYAADEAHPAWRAWMLLVRACAKPADILREALVDAPGLDGAFIFGSTARGDAREDSDVDLMLVGDPDAQEHAGRLVAEAAILIDREVDVVGYDRAELSRRRESGNPFVRHVLAGPKEWVRGDPHVLALAEVA
jgi:predicted nucleotidyltransferase